MQHDSTTARARRMGRATGATIGLDLSDTYSSVCAIDEEGDILEEGRVRTTTPALSLRGASFGDLTRFYSANVERGRTISDFGEVSAWVDRRSGRPTVLRGPCPAAQQLRYLFGKFIRPNGMARRAMLNERGVLAGKKFTDPKEALGGAVRAGYLNEEERLHRVKRTDGDLYSEMVEYVKSMQLTPGLRILLADLCGDDSGEHVSPTRGV